MKNYLFCIIVLLSLTCSAQNSGRGFNYQAVARDENGAIRKSELINIKFSLLANGSTGVAHWIETHSVNTDAYGTFSVIIGKGLRDDNSAFVDFKYLDFYLNNYWLKIEIGEVGLSNQKLLSVPYAENFKGEPAGTVNAYAGIFTTQLEADGWLPCDGRIIDKNDYPILWNAIQEYWGNGGDGAYNADTDSGGLFNVPDLRGQFLRGADQGAGVDPDVASRTTKNSGNTGDNVGSYQEDCIQSHRHRVPTRSYGSGSGAGSPYPDAGGDWSGSPADDGYGVPRVSTETRSKNAYVNYIIKAK